MIIIMIIIIISVIKINIIMFKTMQEFVPLIKSNDHSTVP